MPDRPTPVSDTPDAGSPAHSAPEAGADLDVSRRMLFGISAGTAVVGLANGVAAGAAVTRHRDRSAAAPAGLTERLAASDLRVSASDLPLGLADPVPAFAQMMAFDLDPAAMASPAAARRAASGFLRQVTALEQATTPDTQGVAMLDIRAANLQLTPGIGASLLTHTGLAGRRPAALVDLPRFRADHLDPARCGGDLVVQAAAEDPMRLSGVVQQLVHAAHAHQVHVRWARSGFRNTAAASADPGTTGRNVMGHRDGTANPATGSPLWDHTVRVRTPGWMNNGSYMVVRQISIDLDSWFAHSEPERDAVIGRRTSTGAPLSGQVETDTSDLSARDAAGALVIPASAHLRLANATRTGGARIVRRPWNYDDGFDPKGRRLAGQLFVAWQNDLSRGFIPIQHSLESGGDALLAFLRHEGSAVFAMPAQGAHDYPGQDLLEG